MTDDRLVVGLVRGVQGLRGAVRVEVLTDKSDRFAPGAVVHAEGSQQPLTVVSAQRDGPGLLIRFAEVNDRRAADSLRDVYLEASSGGSLPENAFYWHDIIGCAVETTDGEPLGTVTDIFRVGEAEVYTVRGPRGEVLVPAVAAMVKSIDIAAQRITVDGRALGLSGGDDE